MSLYHEITSALNEGLSQVEVARRLGISRGKLQRELKKVDSGSVQGFAPGRVVVLSDIHIPFEDKTLVDKVLSWLATQKLTGLILNGDVLDCQDISSFVDAEKVAFHQEIYEAKVFLTRLHDALEARSPGVRKVFKDGNHENRLPNYLAKNAKALSGLRDDNGHKIVSIPHLLNLQALGWEHTAYTEVTHVAGDLIVEHGDRVSKHSGRTGQMVQNDKGGSIILGHVHRVGSYYKTDRDGEHGAFECGCLCITNPSYITEASANWQQGFGIVDIDASGSWWYQQVTVRGDRLYVDGGFY